MAFWMIVGGMVLGAWALLSVMAGELTRRTADVHSRARQRRSTSHAAPEPLRVK
jgi:hypothetical protein